MNDPTLKRTVLIVGAVLLALVSAVVLLARVSPWPSSPPTPESPAPLLASPAMITWTPTSTEAIVSPGATRTTTVSFVSSKNIRRASIQVSPELAALVQTDPVSFERIRKGEQKTLTLIVAPSATATLGTITGSIQLLRGQVDASDTEADDEDRRDAGKLLPQALSVVLHVAGVGISLLLPPDPGPAGMTTLAGIDSDGDGVRDDVQRYIDLTYLQSAKERAALTQAAIAIQDELMGSSNGVKEGADALDCIGGTLMTSGADIVGGKNAHDAYLGLEAAVLNTPERAKAFAQADSLPGVVIRFSTPYAQKASRCSIDPTLFPN